MAAGKTIDRRRSPRVESIHLVTFEAEGAASAVEVGRTLDVSAVGARVETPTAVPVGQDLHLDIAVGDRIVRTAGRVVHAERAPDDRWQIGIELVRLTPADRAALVEQEERSRG